MNLHYSPSKPLAVSISQRQLEYRLVQHTQNGFYLHLKTGRFLYQNSHLTMLSGLLGVQPDRRSCWSHGFLTPDARWDHVSKARKRTPWWVGISFTLTIWKAHSFVKQKIAVTSLSVRPWRSLLPQKCNSMSSSTAAA